MKVARRGEADSCRAGQRSGIFRRAHMDLAKVLSQLRQELADLNAAIASLEQFQTERPRRGRPPKGQADASSPEPVEADSRSRDSA